MHRAKLASVILSLTAVAVAASQTSKDKKLRAVEAKDHIGERATVCGTVASTHYVSSSRGQAIFLNLDVPYPNPVFSILIPRSAKSRFGDPERTYRDKQVCVTGPVKIYRGVPEIIASFPDQIKEQPKDQK